MISIYLLLDFLGIFPIYENENDNDKIQLHELIFGRLGADS